MSSRYDSIPQRVFTIFLRPYQVNSNNKLMKIDFNQLFWKDPTVNVGSGSTYVATKFKNLFDMTIPSASGSDPKYLKRYAEALGMTNVVANPTTGALTFTQKTNVDIQDISDELQPFNENVFFTEDVWFLHSVWTSFEECKLYLRPLIDRFGMDAVMCCAYVPLDLELLPNK